MSIHDRESGAPQGVDDLGDRAKSKAVRRDGHLGHRVRVADTDDDPTRLLHDPGELSESAVQLRDEVNGVQRDDAVKRAIRKRQLSH